MTYVNRVLAFMFATEEGFTKLMALPKAGLGLFLGTGEFFCKPLLKHMFKLLSC